MLSIFYKEINSFFSSLIGYIVIGLFLLMVGLMMWFFPDYSLLNYNYASLDQLFDIAPMIFLFLIPAVTMRSMAEENQTGTIELLFTKPITNLNIVLGKYFASLALLALALFPTLIYYYSVYQLGSPVGNLDTGAIIGSYIGLFLLGGGFISIGIFASSITNNQIVSFLLAMFLCFFFYWGFDFVSRIPIFVGKTDNIIQQIGMENHYRSISKGLVDTRDLVYFISIIAVFIVFTVNVLERKRN